MAKTTVTFNYNWLYLAYNNQNKYYIMKKIIFFWHHQTQVPYEEKTFSHTPDEARSVGLVKACVSYKIYSVIEKINWKFTNQTEWETYMPSEKFIAEFELGFKMFTVNRIKLIVDKLYHAFNIPL